MDRDDDGLLKHGDFVQMFQECGSGQVASPERVLRLGSPKHLEGQKTNFVNNDLNRYANKRKEFTAKSGIHSPRCNHISSHGNVDLDMNKTIFAKITDSENQLSIEQLNSLRPQTYGGASKVINGGLDIFRKQNGGTLASCIENNY